MNDTLTQVAIYQEKWIYYMMKNISPKTFDKMKKMELEVKMKVSCGQTEIKDTKYMTFTSTNNKGKESQVLFWLGGAQTTKFVRQFTKLIVTKIRYIFWETMA